MTTFDHFNNGALRLPQVTTEFSTIPWSKHPTFKGVELKHIITAADTQNQFSYHLVRIHPGCAIQNHTHETQLETHEVISGHGTCTNANTIITYTPGTISIIPAGVPHEVIAEKSELHLFAKFIPPLC